MYIIIIEKKSTNCWIEETAMGSTGHEKARVSMCLADKADGTNLKSLTVFKEAKRETAKLNIKFKGLAVGLSLER